MSGLSIRIEAASAGFPTTAAQATTAAAAAGDSSLAARTELAALVLRGEALLSDPQNAIAVPESPDSLAVRAAAEALINPGQESKQLIPAEEFALKSELVKLVRNLFRREANLEYEKILSFALKSTSKEHLILIKLWLESALEAAKSNGQTPLLPALIYNHKADPADANLPQVKLFNVKKRSLLLFNTVCELANQPNRNLKNDIRASTDLNMILTYARTIFKVHDSCPTSAPPAHAAIPATALKEEGKAAFELAKMLLNQMTMESTGLWEALEYIYRIFDLYPESGEKQSFLANEMYRLRDLIRTGWLETPVVAGSTGEVDCDYRIGLLIAIFTQLPFKDTLTKELLWNSFDPHVMKMIKNSAARKQGAAFLELIEIFRPFSESEENRERISRWLQIFDLDGAAPFAGKEQVKAELAELIKSIQTGADLICRVSIKANIRPQEQMESWMDDTNFRVKCAEVVCLSSKAGSDAALNILRSLQQTVNQSARSVTAEVGGEKGDEEAQQLAAYAKGTMRPRRARSRSPERHKDK
jgi:hypothetical protein